MNTHSILPLNVKRVDVTTGGDHGQGALQHGVRVTVVTTEETVLERSGNDDRHAITVESIFAEVICKKDSAAILKLTINDQLVEAMREISESKLEMVVGGIRHNVI